MARPRRRNAARDHPRTVRVNELLREIIGERLERVDDDRLGIVSITAVEVDSELTLAKVYVSSFDDDPATVLEALEDHKGELKKAIGTQARLRRTPDLRFHADAAVQTGTRIEDVLRALAEERAERGEIPELDASLYVDGTLDRAGAGASIVDEEPSRRDPDDRDDEDLDDEDLDDEDLDGEDLDDDDPDDDRA